MNLVIQSNKYLKYNRKQEGRMAKKNSMSFGSKIPDEELIDKIQKDKNFFKFENMFSGSYERCFVAYPKDYVSPSLEHQVIQIITKSSKKIPDEELIDKIQNDKNFFKFKMFSGSYERCFVAYPKDYVSPSLEHQVIQIIKKVSK